MTGQLGTNSSVLGLSMQVGAGQGTGGAGGGGGGTAVLATNAISLGQTPSVTHAPAPKGTSTIALSQAASFVGPKHLVAASTLVLAQSTYFPKTTSLIVSQALTLAQDAAKHGNLNLSASSPITLTQILDTTEKDRTTGNTLALTESADASAVKVAANALTVTDSAVIGQIFVSALTPLAFTQYATPGPRLVSATNPLAVTQSAHSSIRPVAATNPIALDQKTTIWVPKHLAASSQLIVTTQVQGPNPPGVLITTTTGLKDATTLVIGHTQAAQQYISPTQTVWMQHIKAGATDLAASDSITLSQNLIQSQTADASQTIRLQQIATVGVGIPVVDTLSLTATASFTNVHAPEAVSSAITLSDGAAFVVELGNTRFLYSPFVGGSTDPNTPTPPPGQLDYPLANQSTFRLVYPSSGLVSDSLVLRAPNLGNKDRLAFNRINRETRGGTLIVFADPMWPKSQTMVLSFSALNKSEAQALLTFMQNHLGQQVGIIDWEFYYWIGVVTVPTDPIVQDAVDSYTASFEFEGVHATWTEQTITDTNYGCSSTSRVAQQNRNAMVTCDCSATVGSDGTKQSANSAETDVNLRNGTPIYIADNGHLELAVANSAGPAQVAGLSIGTYAPTFSAQYITEGEVTNTDWTAITGSTLLLPGRVYFLDPVSPGMLTAVPPSTVGQYVVPVGRALSTTTFDIELTPSILL